MLKGTRTVRKVSREIADAANGAFDVYRNGEIEEEPAITAFILGAISERIRHLRPHGIVWKTRILRASRGVAAEEGRHGADLMGVLDVDIPDYSTKKGFLAQAKKAEPNINFSRVEWIRLTEQCEIMLKRTPDSFIFVYSKLKGIRIFPAVSVLGLNSRNIFDLYDRGISGFFENFIECFIGDSRLNSASIETLDALADFRVESVLELSARVPE